MSDASETTSEPHAVLDAMDEADARQALMRCCGASRWVDGMMRKRPFGARDALFEAAQTVWRALGREDYLEAFSHHPQIGADLAQLREKFAGTASWSSDEQSRVSGADDTTLLALRDGNLRYLQRFGFIFIVFATGKSAPEMLSLLRERLGHEPDRELHVAAHEHEKITRLRLEKLAV